MSTKYDNSNWSRCARAGGVWVAVIDGNVAQGNNGISLPCRGCWVQRRLLCDTIKMNIGEAATVNKGVELSIPSAGAQPLWVPISDVSQLYFWGVTDADAVDIIYLLG